MTDGELRAALIAAMPSRWVSNPATWQSIVDEVVLPVVARRDVRVAELRDEWRKYAEAYAAKAHDAAHRTPIDYGSLALYGDRAKEANAGVRAVEEVMGELGFEK